MEIAKAEAEELVYAEAEAKGYVSNPVASLIGSRRPLGSQISDTGNGGAERRSCVAT